MKRPGPSLRLIIRAALSVVLSVLVAGCIVVHAVTMPVSLAATTVVVAGKTAGTVVATTGRVAAAAVNAGGSVAADSLDGTAKLAHAGMVTFVDASSGTVSRVPWQPGMTLAGASELAKVRAVQQSLAIVRAGQVIYSAKQNPDVALPLAGGDVIRLAK